MIDLMLSMLPVMLILLLLMETASFLTANQAGGMHEQQMLDKLMAIADYTVKSGATVHENGIRYPNWIDRKKLTVEFAEGLENQTGLSMIYIGLEYPTEEYGACIYRLVVVGQEKEIKQLFVCGSS